MGLRDLYRKWFKPQPEPEVPKALGLTKKEDRLVYKAVTEWRDKMAGFAQDFVDRVNDLAQKNGVGQKYLWHVLYAMSRQWPDMPKDHRRALHFALTLVAKEGIGPMTRDWEKEPLPNEDVVDRIIQELGGWSYIRLVMDKIRTALLVTIRRYTKRFKPVFLEKWHSGGSYAEKDLEGAFILEMVQQVFDKHWRFIDGGVIRTALYLLGLADKYPGK